METRGFISGCEPSAYPRYTTDINLAGDGPFQGIPSKFHVDLSVESSRQRSYSVVLGRHSAWKEGGKFGSVMAGRVRRKGVMGCGVLPTVVRSAKI